jgi:ABC-type nickel/cobalt efflux system permease component RcnA
VGGYAPRAREDSVRPRRLMGASGRPLNFTVRRAMAKSSRWLLAITAVAVVLSVPSWVAWEKWRAQRVHAFCGDALAAEMSGHGMSVQELSRLQQRDGIFSSDVRTVTVSGSGNSKRSELVFADDLETHACVVGHNGMYLTGVQILF